MTNTFMNNLLNSYYNKVVKLCAPLEHKYNTQQITLETLHEEIEKINSRVNKISGRCNLKLIDNKCKITFEW
jgi:hypothetical protein